MVNRFRYVKVAALFTIFIHTVTATEQFSVVLINAWSGLTYRGIFSSGEYETRGTREFRRDLLFRELERLAPDFLGITEANPLPSFSREIAGHLGMNGVYHVGRGGVRIGPVGLPVNLREGDVLLSKGDIELISRRQLTGGNAGNLACFQFGPATQVMAARIEAAGRDVYAFIVEWSGSYFADSESLQNLVDSYSAGHMEGDTLVKGVQSAVKGRETRKAEATATLDFVNQIAGAAPVILMGSLNALPDSPEIEILINGGFADAFSPTRRQAGYTRDEKNNTNILKYQEITGKVPRQDRVDYIFTRGNGIRVISAEVVLDRPTYGVFPSDHYGVAAIIEIDPLP